MSNSVQDRKLPKEWRWAKFDEFLRRKERKVIVDDLSSYDCVGVRWYGMGAFVRENLPGINIARKQQWLIKAGDVVYNKLFAWKGSFALADSNVDDCIVSDKFPTYQLDTTVVNPQFLRYYFRTMDIAQQALALSKGGAAISKLTLNPPQFWDLAIPLPPFKEQQRIVARIEELVAKTEKAQSLHRKAIEASERLLLSTIATLLKPDQWAKFTLSSLLRESSLNGLSTRPSDITTGVPILRISAATSRQDFLIDEEEHKYIELDEQDYHKYKVEPDDILVCRFNGNLHFVGRFALYKQYSGKTHVYPDKLIRLRVDTEKILPEFLCITANSPIVRRYIEAFCATTAGNIGISAGNLKSISIPVPSIKEQKYIVECFHDLQSKIDLLKRKQDKTSVELDAMLPSILDKAFKGEL